MTGRSDNLASRNRLARRPWLVSALAMTGGPAVADAPSIQDQVFDCVMQPHQVVALGSSVQGILSTVAVDRGDQVEQGSEVARLDSGVEEVTVELARLRVGDTTTLEASRDQLAFHRRKLERSARLSREKVLSDSALDEVETEARVAEMNVREAELEQRAAELELRRSEELLKRRTILSPITGVVVERALSPGEYVHEQAAILTIAQVDPLNVEVFVPIGWYGQVRPGMAGEVTPAPPLTGRYGAEVTIVDSVFDTASGTFGVRLEVTNPDGRLPAGARCSVRFGEPVEANRPHEG